MPLEHPSLSLYRTKIRCEHPGCRTHQFQVRLERTGPVRVCREHEAEHPEAQFEPLRLCSMQFPDEPGPARARSLRLVHGPDLTGQPEEILPAWDPRQLSLVRKAIPLCTAQRCVWPARHGIEWEDRVLHVCDAHLWGAEEWLPVGYESLSVRVFGLSVPVPLLCLWTAVGFRDVIDRELHNMGIVDPEACLSYRARQERKAAMRVAR